MYPGVIYAGPTWGPSGMPAMARDSRRDIGSAAPWPSATAELELATAGGHLDDRRMTRGGERASRPHTIRACLTRERH